MGNILLAEDDASMRAFIAGALEKAGYRVTQAEDGLAALDAVRSRSFDLLLSDIVMPGIDGIELASRAGALHPNMKILFITGFAAMGPDNGDVMPGQAKVVAKPFHLSALVEEVNRLVGRPSA